MPVDFYPDMILSDLEYMARIISTFKIKNYLNF